ncbi:MAG: TonB-dependent receptor, partial [Pyrinomonadaceae bacterium]
MNRNAVKVAAVVICFFSLLLSSVEAQSSTSVSGRVTDALTGNALPGASVTVDGTALTTETDITGAFTLVRVPSGNQKFVITYLGFETKSMDITVGTGNSQNLSIQLSSGIQESVTVNAPLLEGQSKALNQQKEALNIQSIVSADQIGRFPDPNSAEAAQRIPGITIERDQGEGRYVQVRGTEARLNSMQLNGERIPSPEGDVRAVALDVIPADLLDSIEVSKALTADQDADSIGGSVNLVTKGAPEKTRVSATFGWGYNRIAKNDLQTFNGTVGRRFFDKKLGFLFSASYLNTDRGSESVEPSYDDGDLEELEIRDYRVNRTRWGINPYLDYRFSDSSEIYFRGIFNRFGDQEYRRLVNYKVADNEIERELKDRFEEQTISQGAFGGRHLLPGFMQIDYRLSYGYADENEPNAAYSTFLQEDVDFDPNVSEGSIDPKNIQANPLNEDISQHFFDGINFERNFTAERSFTAQFNAALPFRSGSGFAGTLKFGVKNRFNKKKRDNNLFDYDVDGDDVPPLSGILDPNYSKGSYRGGLYNFIPSFQDPQRMRDLANGVEFELDPEEDSADYRARENIFAFYGMAQLNFGDKFVLVPGVRYEQTNVRYTGYSVLFDEEGDFDSIEENNGNNDFRNWFPSLHAKYRFAENTNFRAAYTRSLARPNYVDLVPFQLIIQEDLEIERGNPFLKPTTSDNFDVLVEHYFSNVGVISGGFFYK